MNFNYWPIKINFN